jgi:pullulanase/glycogen debranching enzyme
VVADGVNFSIYSQHATQVELLLFEAADSPLPFQVIPLEAGIHRAFFFWHILVVDLPPGTCYAWRIDGPDAMSQSGFHFDRDKVLRTQHGNNNVWCQDNELGWFDWDLVERNADMQRFTQLMIAFRKRHPCLTHAFPHR